MIAIADCNSFYASCERLFRPDLAGKPIVVLSNNDGCIVSRTDEAKRLGIDMAVPYFQCKDIMQQHGVHVFSSNYHLYGDISQRVMDIFRSVVGQEMVEVYSVDEAFLDFNLVPPAEYYKMALHIKEYTEQCTGIPICVGVAPNKLLSKVANKLAKKNKVLTKGVKVLATHEEIYEALESFDVKDIWGIGGRYGQKLHNLGITTAARLRNMPLEWCRKNLGGVVGVRLLRQLRGESISEMNPPLEVKKMIACTRMFGKNVTALKDIEEAIVTYTARAAEKLRRQNSAAGEISVFLMYQDMSSRDYSIKSTAHYELLTVPTSNTIELAKAALRILRKICFGGRNYKKGGVMLSRFVTDESIQGNLFEPAPNLNRKLMLAIDNINFSQGPDTIVLARAGLNKHWKMRQELRSPKYTTDWKQLRVVI